MVRILTGLLLAAGAFGIVFVAPRVVLIATVVALGALALHEFFGITTRTGLRTFRTPGHLATALWLLTPHLDRGYFATLLAICLLATGIFARAPVAEVLPTAAVTLAGVVYIAGPMLSGLLLHDMSPHWLAYVLIIVAVGDSVALGVGRAIGRHPLAPEASPRKTWEGTIASLVAGTLAGWTYATVFLDGSIHPAESAALAVVVNVFGQVGDIAQSVMKRAAGMKDSGSILPGHGGLLDRIDGFLFAMPAAYGYLYYLR